MLFLPRCLLRWKKFFPVIQSSSHMRLAPIFAALMIVASTLCAFAKVLARFDGWMIVGGSGSDLIALMDDGSTPLIAVSCSSSLGGYLFTLPVIDRRDIFADAERKASYFRFLAWSDSGPAQEFTAVWKDDQSDVATYWFQQILHSMKNQRACCGACSKHLESSSRTARRQVTVR